MATLIETPIYFSDDRSDGEDFFYCYYGEYHIKINIVYTGDSAAYKKALSELPTFVREIEDRLNNPK
jgi:hypothetical protein